MENKTQIIIAFSIIAIAMSIILLPMLIDFMSN